MVLLVDDLILGPGRFMSWISAKLNRWRKRNNRDKLNTLRRNWPELYNQFETGAIKDEEFDAREYALLDRLESLQGDHSKHPGTGRLT